MAHISINKSKNLVGVDSHGNSKHSAKSEVSYLDDSILIDQEILRLQVAVEHSSAMAIQNSLQNLKIQCNLNDDLYSDLKYELTWWQ